METLDKRWIKPYKTFAGYANSADSLLRSSDTDEQKTAFIKNGFSKNPTIKPKIDLKKVGAYQEGITLLAEKIGEKEDEEIVKAAYLPRLGELATYLSMVRSSAEGDSAGFLQANVETFGEPYKLEFNAALGFFHDYIDQRLETDWPPLVRALAAQAKDILPDTSTPKRRWPDQGDFEKAKSLYSNYFDEILEGINLPNTVGPRKSFPAARRALKNLGLGDYKVVPQSEGITTMAVNHDDQEVKIPKTASYSKQRFIGLLGHEIRVHIEERKNGEKAPLMILYSGLKRSLRGSEGKGLLVEQVVYGSFDEFMDTRRFFDIARRHLSIGLARGIDGDGERDFKEVFKIINAIDMLDEAQANPDNLSLASAKAIDRTWELLAQRTLRGWTGRGTAAFKDKIYLEASLDQLGALLKNPALFPYMNKGKYDASNPEHLRILTKVGMIPEQVTSLRA